MIDALAHPERYAQSAISPISQLFDGEAATAQCGPHTYCPAFEGETRIVNGRKYKLYCINAPWGSYFWLPQAQSLGECESKCHNYKGNYDCNALTYYPSTKNCALIYSKDAKPYIWDNGYAKVGMVKDELDMGLGPGQVCPLPTSENQVWDFDVEGSKVQFKMSCTQQFNVPPSAKKSVGQTKTVDDCAEKAVEAKAYGFHYYQPSFPGGRADGLRNCEVITEAIKEDKWVPYYKPNQYLAGLKVSDAGCGDDKY